MMALSNLPATCSEPTAHALMPFKQTTMICECLVTAYNVVAGDDGCKKTLPRFSDERVIYNVTSGQQCCCNVRGMGRGL